MTQLGFALGGVRRTSISTYRAIEHGGLLSQMRWLVYRTLYHHGPLTGRELDDRLARDGETRTSYHKRLSELERMGVVASVAERSCKITGRHSIVWDVTANLPIEAPRLQRVDWRERCLQLEAKVRELSERLQAVAGVA